MISKRTVSLAGTFLLAVTLEAEPESMKESPDVRFRETTAAQKTTRDAFLVRQHGAKPIQRTMKALAKVSGRE